MTRTSVLVSHGSGPLALLGAPGHAPLVQALQGLAAHLPGRRRFC
jgi:hypothetical protein